jgi:outer membrane immunogenic protein
MHRLLRTGWMLLVLVSLLLGNGAGAVAQGFERAELGAGYSYVHTNAPPGDCGCFAMNGGSAWFGYHFTREWALAAEVGSEHASNIDGTGAGLTLTSYLAGPRYVWHYGHRVSPFGQVLLGGAHADGGVTLVRFGVAEPANSLALASGGGVDIGVKRHWAARGQLDYFLTRFSNGVNDHQNNLRVSVGVVYRFGGWR